jgi:hypothetical protein
MRGRVAAIRERMQTELELLETNQRDGVQPMSERGYAMALELLKGQGVALEALELGLGQKSDATDVAQGAEILAKIESTFERARSLLVTAITGTKPGGEA